MKALTVKQPWASLIVAGYKDVENRSRPTKHRGPLAIHVSQRPAPSSVFRELPYDQFPPILALLAMSPKAGMFGHVIGTVDVVDCVRNYGSPWAKDDYCHWILDNPQTFDEPVPAKGRLGLWEWDD